MRINKFAKAAGIIILICFITFLPNIIRSYQRWKNRDLYSIMTCQSNLKNIGTALEIYSRDNEGQYPSKMALLTPEYLEIIPTCPGAGRDSYSHYYRSSADHKRYTFFCNGENHPTARLKEGNWPQYSSIKGMFWEPEDNIEEIRGENR